MTTDQERLAKIRERIAMEDGISCDCLDCANRRVLVADLQFLLDALVLARRDAQDADRWRRLTGCARLRLIGGAGQPMHHAGFDFWHAHPHPSDAEDVRLFTDFVDRIPASGPLGASDA